MQIALAVTLFVASILALLVWSARESNRRHRAFGKDDVLQALDNVLSEEVVLHDKWDMFLARPIDDAYLESIRQRCLSICSHDKPGAWQDLSESAAAEVDAIRRELHEAPDRSFKPAPSGRLDSRP